MPVGASVVESIIAFVAEERGMPRAKVRLIDRLEEDLGMTGDDAADFLEGFARRFDVDLTGLDFHKHFGPEGFNPFWWLAPPDFLKSLGRYPVTVAHLAEVAAARRWICPPEWPDVDRSPL